MSYYRTQKMSRFLQPASREERNKKEGQPELQTSKGEVHDFEEVGVSAAERAWPTALVPWIRLREGGDNREWAGSALHLQCS